MKQAKTLLTLMMIAIVMSVSAYASDEEISVILDGQPIIFDVQPTTINDRTMVPVRAIFEALGASVEWSDATQTVTAVKGETTVTLTIDSTTMYVNGSAIALDAPATVINDRTLVPVRAISEAFGCQVGWDDTDGLVSIISDTYNYIMLYAQNNRSRSFPYQDAYSYMALGWYRDPQLTPNILTTNEVRELFIECVLLGSKCQNNATDSLLKYFKTSLTSNYAFFVQYLNNAYKSIENAYNISLKYSDLLYMTRDLKNILTIYEFLLRGDFSFMQLGPLLEILLKSYDNIFFQYTTLTTAHANNQ